MKLLKQLTIAIALTLSLASVSSAFAAGKIENATAAQVKEAAEAAFKSAEQALVGVKALTGQYNDSVKEVMQLRIKNMPTIISVLRSSKINSL